MDPVAMELPESFTPGSSQSRHRASLEGNRSKRTHLGDQDNRAEEADAPEGLEKTDTVIDRIALQIGPRLMQLFQYTVQMRLDIPGRFFMYSLIRRALLGRARPKTAASLRGALWHHIWKGHMLHRTGCMRMVSTSSSLGRQAYLRQAGKFQKLYGCQGVTLLEHIRYAGKTP